MAQNLVTDRPDQTESSVVVPSGFLQVESGLFYEISGTEDVRLYTILYPTTLFRLGISERIELRMLNQLERTKLSSTFIENITQGISDLEVGFKIALAGNSETRFSAAFLSHLIMPTGTGEISTDSYQSVNKLALGLSLTDNISTGLNIGYQFREESEGLLLYSLVAGISINDRISLFTELYGSSGGEDGFILDYNNGFTYLIKHNLQLDLAFGTGLTREMNYAGTGISVLF